MKIDTTLYTGRPQDVQGRSPQELACYDLLDHLSIPYTRVDHEHADTIAHCQEVETYLKAHICKNLFLCNRQKTDFYLLVMRGRSPSTPRTSPNRSALPGSPSRRRKLWRSCWTSPPVPPPSWP